MKLYSVSYSGQHVLVQADNKKEAYEHAKEFVGSYEESEIMELDAKQGVLVHVDATAHGSSYTIYQDYKEV